MKYIIFNIASEEINQWRQVSGAYRLSLFHV